MVLFTNYRGLVYGNQPSRFTLLRYFFFRLTLIPPAQITKNCSNLNTGVYVNGRLKIQKVGILT